MSEVRAGSSRSELLPCPFCGRHANVVDDAPPAFPDQIWYGVGCSNPNCTAYTGYGMRLFVNRADAIAAWNRRANNRTTTRNGRYRTKYGRKVPLCECCGYSIGDLRWKYCPGCGAEVVEP